MRTVVDTSTIIRGLLRRFSEPAYIVDQIKNGNYKLLMTEEMAKELSIAIYLMCLKNNLEPKKFLRATSVFTLHATPVDTITRFTSCSDPEDAMFIECAVDGQAECCISSDHSVYEIKDYCKDEVELTLIKDIEFYNPQDFYNFVVNKVPKGTK
jgi:putative PIN family toxin of toxin-antitoxin system